MARSTTRVDLVGVVLAILLITAWGAGTDGQDRPAVVRSVSGQFVVTGPPRRSPIPPISAEGTTLRNWAELEPATLALTCERVRAALQWEFQLTDPWRGRIYVVVNPSIPNNQAPVIAAKYFTDGWQYRMEVPAWIESPKLVRALVQVLFLEFANRAAATRSAEIPLWLLEGTTQHLLHSSLADLVVNPPERGSASIPYPQTPGFTPTPFRQTLRQDYRPDPLAEARGRLQAHAALSFSRMAEVTADDLPEQTWKTFQASTQVFLFHLMQMPGTRPALLAMLRQLPYCHNWQTAFLETFAPPFQRMIDVEKWWSVVLVHFTGLDPLNAWSLGVALDKLDELLHPPVLVPGQSNELPHRHKASLQEILERWDYLRQRIVLQGVLNQLQTVRIKMPPEVVGLLDDYRRALADYMDRRNRLGLARSNPSLPHLSADRLVREIKTTLDRLDEQRTGQSPQTSQTAPTPPNPSVKPGDIP